MKRILLLFCFTGLFLQAGRSKVTPAKEAQAPVQWDALTATPDHRPHSAPDPGSGLKKKTSLGCLKFMAEEQRRRANTIATPPDHRPQSADSRSGSVSPGTITGTFKIKGVPKGSPFKLVVGSPAGDGSKEERRETHTQAVMGRVGAIAEEHSMEADGEGDEEEGDEEGVTCLDQAGACCKKVVKFVVGLAACL